MAKLAYAAYGQTTDFKNFQGNPMPAWDDLGDPIRRAWTAAAAAVASYLVGPPAIDESAGYTVLHDRINPGD